MNDGSQKDDELLRAAEDAGDMYVIPSLVLQQKKSPDRDDFEMLFRCGMQFMRHLAKKYGFTIKQWPEK